MSWQASGAVWDGYPEGGTKKLILLALADFSNPEGGSIYPSISRIAEMAGINRRQTQYLLRDLETEGYVRVVGNHDGGNAPRQYHLNMELLEAQAELRRELRKQKRNMTSVGGRTGVHGCNGLHPRGALHCTRTTNEPPVVYVNKEDVLRDSIKATRGDDDWEVE